MTIAVAVAATTNAMVAVAPPQKRIRLANPVPVLVVADAVVRAATSYNDIAMYLLKHLGKGYPTCGIYGDRVLTNISPPPNWHAPARMATMGIQTTMWVHDC